METKKNEPYSIRIISCAFVIISLLVFKPFGLALNQVQTYLHLLILFILGLMVCFLSDTILKFLLHKPKSKVLDPTYIIRRNLWFQIINSPLIAFMISLYRHFVLIDLDEGNALSSQNFLENLLIIVFCSFAIGLYWRFKFRSRYLAAELEETRLLNKHLAEAQKQSTPKVATKEDITLTGSTSDSLSLQISDLLYVEAVGNYVKVYHLRNGQPRTDMLRATSKQMEDKLSAFPMIVRCHRAFLVNLQQIEKIVSNAGTMQLHIKHTSDSIPVSRSNMAQIKEAINNML